MSKRLIIIRGSAAAPLLKSHVEGYSRKDGAYVKPHDDKRTKKADAYSHPHAVGKAELTDQYADGAHDASSMKFAGAHYGSTGKSGSSFHDKTPVREFESEDGHRVWMDHHSRVHADDKAEVPSLRAKFEAHSAGEKGGEDTMDDKDRFDAGPGDPVHGSEGGSGKHGKADPAPIEGIKAAAGGEDEGPDDLPGKGKSAEKKPGKFVKGDRVLITSGSRKGKYAKVDGPHAGKGFAGYLKLRMEGSAWGSTGFAAPASSLEHSPADKDRFDAGPGDPVHGSEGGSGKLGKADKTAVLNAALGQHNVAAGYIAIPPSTNAKVKEKMDEMAKKVKPLGFKISDVVKLNANGNGTLVLSNKAGERVAISAQDAGDRHRISVSLLDAPEAGGAGAAETKRRGAVDDAIASSNRSGKKIGGKEAKAIHSLLADRPHKPETGAVAEGNKLAYGSDDPKGKGVAAKGASLAALKKHPMHSESDLAYFQSKGYDADDIKAIWDRDHAAGHKPVEHKQAPDVTGIAGDPDHYKKGQGSLFKALANGVRLFLKSDVGGYTRKDGTAVKPHHRLSRVEGAHRYEYANGKKPRGSGSWIFSPHEAHDFNAHGAVPGTDYFEHRGSYTEAKDKASQWGRDKGHAVVHVQS